MIDEESLRSLEKLHQLKTDGVITEADFEAAKERLLTAPAAQAKAVKGAGPIEIPADDNHFGWMVLALRRYADFTGRSSRKEFWMFLLFTNLIGLCLGLMFVADTDVFGDTGPIAKLAMVTMVLGVLAALVPFLAVQVRRFHDQGKSGWFALLNLIPYVGPLVVLGFMLIQGEEGDNQFGADPR